MIQRVYEQAGKTPSIDRVIVATDDIRIVESVLSFGGSVEMTSPDHANGTQRIAEVAANYPEYELVLNVQGDEPFIRPEQLSLVIDLLTADPQLAVASLKKRIEKADELFDPNVVKVISDVTGRAIYFSRQAIPYLRAAEAAEWPSAFPYFKHIGLYGFRRNRLFELVSLPVSPLEQAESLEQLRWLEQGFRIGLAETTQETIGIDHPDDLEKISHLL